MDDHYLSLSGAELADRNLCAVERAGLIRQGDGTPFPPHPRLGPVVVLTFEGWHVATGQSAQTTWVIDAERAVGTIATIQCELLAAGIPMTVIQDSAARMLAEINDMLARAYPPGTSPPPDPPVVG